jgi:hypothetical protein
MKAITSSIFLTLIFATANAQTAAEKEAVMKPVKMLFEGMQKGDSTLARSAFAKKVTSARLGTDKNGKPFIQYESSIDGFIKAIGTPHKEAWNEVIWNEKIEIDGNLAQVWADFAFYLGKKLNHCGVDAFQLVKGEDGEWRIFHLADTGRTEGCKVPSSISKKFE